MDDKTWQQVTLGGSTVTVRGNQGLQAQNLPSAAGGVYPGAPSNHWQRMTCCSRFNTVTNSQNIPSQQQFNQIQQQVPLRYYQIQKPATTVQYGNQITSASLGQHHLGNHANHQQHFAHLYTVLRTSSNDSSITEKRSRYARENATVTQSLSSLKSSEDVQIFNNHNNNRTDDLNNHTKIQPNLISTVDKSSKYQIFTNARFVGPETPQTSSLSIPIDHVISQTLIAPENRERNLSQFVNAIEAVPDMLREVRPGSTSFYPENSSKFCFFIDQDEFSYHVSKPELRIETAVANTEIHSDKTWPELSLRNHRSYASTIDRKIVDLRIEEKTCCEADSTISKEIFIKETDSDEKSYNYERYAEKIMNTSPTQKTYADAVQLMTGRHEISSPRHLRIDEVRRNIRRIKLPEETTKLANVPHAPFCDAVPNKIAARCMRKKREYESCEEDNDNTTMFISNELGKNTKNHDVCSWRNVEILKNDKATSSLRAEQYQGRSPSRKRMCKMAETFCLEHLENPTFFRAFDDYNRRRRRMSYTRKFEAKPEVTWCQQNEASHCKIRGEVTLIAGLTLQRGDPFFYNDLFSTKFRRNVFSSNSPVCEEMLFRDSGMISQLRVNSMIDTGVFKVLQKLKECADGTGALYKNSWRPEEIHFLRRCHRDKMVV